MGAPTRALIFRMVYVGLNETTTKGTIMAIMLPPLSDLRILTERSGQCYIAHGGKELYVSGPDGTIVQFTGPDFGAMTDDEVSQYIIDQITP